MVVEAGSLLIDNFKVGNTVYDDFESLSLISWNNGSVGTLGAVQFAPENNVIYTSKTAVTTSTNINTGYIRKQLPVDSYIDLAADSTLYLDVAPSFPLRGWSIIPINLTLGLIDEAGVEHKSAVYPIEPIPPATVGNGELIERWRTVEFDLSSLPKKKYKEIRIYNEGGVNTSGISYKYFFENMKFKPEVDTFYSKVTDENCIYLCDFDTLWAKNVDPNFTEFVHYSFYTVRVLPYGRQARNLFDTLCATEGCELRGVNLVKNKYSPGGALIGEKHWYYDENLKFPIPDPKSVTFIADSMKVWAEIIDMCDARYTKGKIDPARTKASVTLTVNPRADLKDYTAEVCADLFISQLGNQARVSLDSYNNNIRTQLPCGTVWTTEWYTNEALTIRSQNSLNVTETATFYAKVYHKDPTCFETAKLTINIIHVDKIKFDSAFFCADAPDFILSATPVGGVFTGNCIIGGNIFRPSIVGSGNCYIKYTLSGRCPIADSAKFTVYPPITGTITSSIPNPIPYNASPVLTINASPNSATYSYVWSNGATTKVNNVGKLTNRINTFSVTVTDNVTKCQAVFVYNVEVASTDAYVQLQMTPVCEGDSVKISAVGGGIRPFTYQWTVGSLANKYRNITDSTIMVYAAESSIISVKLKDKRDSSATDTKTLTVYDRPEITLNDIVGCQNETICTTAVVTGGTAPFTHAWVPSTEIISGLSSPSVCLNSTVDKKYNLTYTVEDVNKCKATKSVAVTINPTPVIQDIKFDKTVCATDTTRLQPIYGQGGWDESGTDVWTSIPDPKFINYLTSANVSNPIFTAPQNYGDIIFIYEYTNEFGCSAKDSAKITILTNPIVDIADIPSLCRNNDDYLVNATVTSENAPFVYKWSDNILYQTGSSAAIDISKPIIQTVSVTVTDANNCVSDPVSEEVRIYSNPDSTILGKNTVCKNADLPLCSAQIKTNQTTYAWSSNGINTLDTTAGECVIFNSKNEGPFTVTLFASHQPVSGLTCTSRNTHRITVNGLPEFTLGPDRELCQGDTAILNPRDTLGVPLVRSNYDKILWTKDKQNLNIDSILNPIYTQYDTKTYTLALRLENTNGCHFSDTIVFKGLPLPIANAGNDTTVAPLINYNLNGSASGGTPGYTYQWVKYLYFTSESDTSNPNAQINLSEQAVSTTYTLLVTDSKGCKDRDDVTYSPCGNPPSVYPTQDTICVGDTMTLYGGSAGGECKVPKVFAWYDGNKLIGTNENIEIIKPENGHTYTFKYKSGLYDTVSKDIKVFVMANPEIAVSPSNFPLVCFGSTIQIHAEADVPGYNHPLSYEWIDGTGMSVDGKDYYFKNSSSVGKFPVYIKATETVYGCYNLDTIEFEVVPIPSVIINNDTACTNNPLDIHATATGGTTANGSYTYYWTDPSNKFLTYSEDSPDAVFLSDSKTAGRYPIIVEVVDDNDCRDKDTATILLNLSPVKFVPNEIKACSGDTVEIDFNPENNTDYTRDVTVSILNPVSAKYVITNIDGFKKQFFTDIPGEYVIKYTLDDKKGCPYTDSIVMIIGQAISLDPIYDFAICAAIDTTLVPVVKPGSTLNIEFLWTGNNLSSRVGETTTFTGSKPGPYNISLLAKNGVCSDQIDFTITVHPNPVIDAGFAPNPILIKDTYDLKAIITTQTTAPYGWTWTPSHNILGDNKLQNVKTIITSDSTIDFVVTVEDAFSCKATDNVLFQVIKRPEIKLGWPIEKDIVSLNNQVDTLVIPVEWIKEPVLCFGDSVQLLPYLTGESAALYKNYSWSKYNETTGKWDLLPSPKVSQVNPFVKPAVGSHRYKVEIRNNSNDIVTAEKIVIVRPKPSTSILITPDLNGRFYKDTEFQLYGLTGIENEVTHDWTASASGVLTVEEANRNFAKFYAVFEKNYTVQYKATATYADITCADSALLNIFTEKLPSPKLKVTPQCVTMESTLSISDGYTGYWQVSGGDIIGNNKDTDSIQVLWKKSGYQYVTVLVNQTDTTPTFTLEDSVLIYDIAKVDILGKQNVCERSNEIYEAVGEYETVRWYLDSWERAAKGDSILITDSRTDTLITVSWKEEGNDVLTVIAYPGGCSDTASLDVAIHNTPEPSFTYTPNTIINSGDEVKFTNTTTWDTLTKQFIDDVTIEYYWDYIGDGVYSDNIFQDSYYFDEVGVFNVQLMAVDTIWGCKGYVSNKVVVIPNDSCYMTFPNAITPQLSQNNKFYGVKEEGVIEEGFDLKIYNRWGELMFETTDKSERWDGMYNGNYVKQDVYVYHCKATCEKLDNDGKHVILNIQGDITVIK
ncbi:MAG: gliding motility-associated C-terminal domain-containing protein [Bacteroidales bacterium]|nr:gliding motility-associated C-terminal domain-containing protein [Bacteroidales bacterium]